MLLNRLRHSLKSGSAWLLTLLIVGQWIGGRVFIQVVYTARIEHRMSAQEEAIARKLKAEIGVTAHVQIQDKAEFKVIQGMGYGAPFLFSEEQNGETQYYTLDAKSPHGKTNEATIAQPEKQEERNLPKQLTERFFADYCFEVHQNLIFQSLLKETTTTAQPVNRQDWLDEAYGSIPSPPPQLYFA